jgi:hypothetical protein
MPPSGWLTRHLSIGLVVCAQLWACTPRPIPVLSEAQRQQLGTVGVVQIARGPRADTDVPRGRAPGAGKGAAAGAAAGALEGLRVLAHGSCSGYACGIVIILLPVFIAAGAAVGAVHGGAVAVPDATGQRIEAELQRALADVGTQQALRSEVVTTAARRGITHVRDVTAERPTVLEDEADYRALSGSGVDTVLEVGLVAVGLSGAGGRDPDLVLRVQAAARLVDVRNSQELYRNDSFTYVSPRRHFTRWSADQGTMLRQEISRAYASLGTSIADEVFLTVRSD